MRDRPTLGITFFKTFDFGDGITRIEGTGSVYCYLVEGRKRALLIDTMTGLGNLRLFVRSLTRLPVTVVCTHGHPDHASGAYYFDEVWISPQDMPILVNTVDQQFEFEKMICRSRHLPISFTRADFAQPRSIIWHSLVDGSRFDLGWRIVTAVPIPGHTKGSMGLLDSKTGILFVGDAISRSTFMFPACSTSVETYLRGLLRLKQMRECQITEFYNFHNYTEMPPTILGDVIQGCRDALDGKIEGGKFKNVSKFRFVYPVDRAWRRLDGKYGNLIVDTTKLFDK